MMEEKKKNMVSSTTMPTARAELETAYGKAETVPAGSDQYKLEME